MKTPQDIEIDWDVIVYDYDPATGLIMVANWLAGKPPLPIAQVPRQIDAVTYIDQLVHGLVNKANEKLAADLLAREISK